MQITSRAYKTEQKQYLRNEQYIYVYLGVISREAQASAYVEGDFTTYSDPQAIFGNEVFEAYYATAEQNMARCDGSQFFLPRNEESFALYQGLVTQDILGAVTFEFENYHRLNIKGLTIDFGDFFPTRFTITNGHDTYTYENDTEGSWSTEDEYLDTDYLTLTVHEMVGGIQRLRILSILFGLGFVFDNTNLISTSWKAEVAHLSDTLPSKTFSFTIDNLSKKFSADNPHSFVAFLEEQQDVKFDFGRKLDDGTIYRIPGGRMNLNSWSSDDTQAKFTAVGYLDYSTGKFIKGQYYPNGITLYDLAVQVCEDAGYVDYSIDTYLKKLTTHNPLPIELHKNLLQLIANASFAILRETRDGKIEIKTSFEPDIIDIDSNGHTDYSVLANLVDTTAVWSEYATNEKDFVYADGHQFFRPRNSAVGLIEGGYVSSAVSDVDGQFSDVPCLWIEWEAKWTFFDVTLRFSDVLPKQIGVATFRDGEMAEVFYVTENIDFQTVIDHDFYNIDKIMFGFLETNPYQRIHVGKIIIGSVTDYSIDYMDMSTTPVAAKTEFVRNVNVVCTEFDYGTEKKSISTVTTVEEGLNTLEFNTAYHDYSLAYKEIKDDEEAYTKMGKVFTDNLPSAADAKTNTIYYVPTGNDSYYFYIIQTVDGDKEWRIRPSTTTESIVSTLPGTLSDNVLYLVETDTEYVYHLYTKYNNETYSLGYDIRGTLEIIESGAYYLSFTTNIATPVVVSGIEFLIGEQTFTKQLYEIGADKTATNILIDNMEHAEKEAEWLSDYYKNDVEYTITYRGEPALDPDDQIYIENKFVSKNLIRITDTQINTGTGMSMSCVLHGRRISYTEPARVDYAIVDVSEVSE